MPPDAAPGRRGGVRQERFHVWSVVTVAEGMALLTGCDAGTRGSDGRFPDGTVNAAIEAALAANLNRLKELRPS
jgi:hypothetical protein